MKTIAVFHPSSELYGADRIMVLATKALKDFHPIIYLPKHGELTKFIAKELPQAEVKIIRDMPVISRALFSPKGAFNTLNKYWKFKRYIQQEHAAIGFDKIYINTLACSILLPAVKTLNVPIFTHVHEILERPKVAAKLTAKLAFKYSHTVISVSEAVQKNLHSLCTKRKGSSIIVHNGIPAIPNRPFSFKENELSFYLFGRIKPEKGQWYLLEALKLIPKQELEGVQFNLVGGTLEGKEGLKTDLEKLIIEYGLYGLVNIKGFTNDISGEMSLADVCLVPSLMKDPFPTTVLEAMSAGKVVIASNTGGAKEAIDHNKTGFIIPPDSPQVFAETIQKLIKDRSMINRIGADARASFNEKFTINHFNTRWLSVINAA